MTAREPIVELCSTSPVEDFLDELLAASAGAPPRTTRCLLAEAEAHLRDATKEAVEQGLSPTDAERDAVRRFGSAAELTRLDAERRALPLSALVRPCVGSGLLLGGLSGIAMGVSAVVTAVMGAVGGSTFIVNISPHTPLAAADCTRWLANNPSAHSCYQAALADWAGETVANRAVLGVLGVMALVAFVVLRRRWSARHLVAVLPRNMFDAVAFTVFGVAGVWLASLGIASIAGNAGRGAGQELGTAPAMLILSVVFGLRMIGDFRTSASGCPVPS